MKTARPKTVDEYIASWPPDVRAKLQAIRKIVNQEAPQAEEQISYGIPYYGLNGRLLYFAAQKQHIGLYAMPSAIVRFKNELKSFGVSKGTIRFPLDKPLPLPLIRKIIKFRVSENRSRIKS